MVNPFFPRFAAFFGAPYLLLHVLPLSLLLEGIARVQSFALNAAGFSSLQNGVFVSSNAAWFQIVPSCSGLVMVILLFALLYATPVKKPMRFFAVFAPALFSFNFLRLFSVMAVGGTYGLEAMNAVHAGLWFVDAALVLWLWFVAFSVSPKNGPQKVL
ncbi:exosortase/archaeosortase family protein [Candidatus Micrarchaeota archaeon]|nr:exosortase/archaeosortase family protein [Candidatus Micrarchaeota archaeon]